MKAFSLDEYLKNPSRKVVTRDGRNVKIRSTDYYHRGKRFVIAEVEGDNRSFVFNSFGVQYPAAYSSIDLFFAPEKHEGWVNVYRDFDGLMCGSVFATEEDAKHNTKTAIATVEIEWEE